MATAVEVPVALTQQNLQAQQHNLEATRAFGEAGPQVNAQPHSYQPKTHAGKQKFRKKTRQARAPKVTKPRGNAKLRDEENLKIALLRVVHLMDWPQIVKHMNHLRRSRSMPEDFTDAAVYGRFKRNGSRLMEAAGHGPIDPRQYMHMDQARQWKKEHERTDKEFPTIGTEMASASLQGTKAAQAANQRHARDGLFVSADRSETPTEPNTPSHGSSIGDNNGEGQNNAETSRDASNVADERYMTDFAFSDSRFRQYLIDWLTSQNGRVPDPRDAWSFIAERLHRRGVFSHADHHINAAWCSYYFNSHISQAHDDPDAQNFGPGSAQALTYWQHHGVPAPTRDELQGYRSEEAARNFYYAPYPGANGHAVASNSNVQPQWRTETEGGFAAPQYHPANREPAARLHDVYHHPFHREATDRITRTMDDA